MVSIVYQIWDYKLHYVARRIDIPFLWSLHWCPFLIFFPLVRRLFRFVIDNRGRNCIQYYWYAYCLLLSILFYLDLWVELIINCVVIIPIRFEYKVVSPFRTLEFVKTCADFITETKSDWSKQSADKYSTKCEI